MYKSDLRLALDAFDFTEFLQTNDVYVEEKGSELRGVCPLCLSEARLPFCVNPENGMWICHHCGEKGNGVSLIARVLHISYRGALDKLASLSKYKFDPRDEEPEVEDYKEVEVEDTVSLPEEFRLLSDNMHSTLTKAHLDYLYGRNVTDDLIRDYRIGYCTSGRYTGRVIIPVYHFGRVVNFVARSIQGREPKVLTPFGNHQNRYCFNLDRIWGERDDVVIVEGVFDALTIPERAVATFGKKITSEQVLRLKEAGMRHITFCWDNDAVEAESFALRWRGLFETMSLLELPEGEDPSSLGRVALLELLDRSSACVL